MEELLSKVLSTKDDLPLEVLGGRLLLAFALGFAVAGIHRLTTRRNNGETSTLSVTLVLLSILIAMVTHVIGSNIARAFSLVGALAIVRFRTVVEDTRDTAFVIFAVVEGMAAGGGHLPVALIGLGVAGLAAFVMQPSSLPSSNIDCTLSMRVGLRQGQENAFERYFQPHLDKWTLTSASTARQGAALELTWQIRLKPGVSVLVLVGELTQIEGVQSVDIQRR